MNLVAAANGAAKAIRLDRHPRSSVRRDKLPSTAAEYLVASQRASWICFAALAALRAT